MGLILMNQVSRKPEGKEKFKFSLSFPMDSNGFDSNELVEKPEGKKREIYHFY